MGNAFQSSLDEMLNKVSEGINVLDSTQLSEVQKEVVTSDSKKVIVVAGAGSGKTRVITERVKYLLEQGVDPSSIVSITFTNLAADEMKERLNGVKGIGDCFIGTIHAFANKIYSSSGKEYKIYNDEIDNDFHKYLVEKYCKFLKFDKYLKYKDMQVAVDMGLADESQLNEFLLPTEAYELGMLEGRTLPHGGSSNKSLKNSDKFYQQLEELSKRDYPETIKTLKKLNNVIGFDELIQYATEYFKSLNSQVEYLLVDEFQDVGSLEYKFITNLNAINYFLVGDDWQSIYGFKGGNVKLFLGLMRDKAWKKYYLTENYRNSKSVLAMADRIIAQVPNRINKQIKRMSSLDGNVLVNSKDSVIEYLNLIHQFKNYKDWFFMVRSNKELHQIANMMTSMGIPFSTFRKSEKTLSELRKELESDTIKLLTVHTAKGLETNNAILYGNFPIKVPGYLQNDEERKVMYVGATRARDKLIILN